MGAALPTVQLVPDGVSINGRLRKPDVTARRQVHFVGSYVVKVDRDQQNWAEWKTWSARLRPADRRFFAPVVAFSGNGATSPRGERSWLIQTRITFRSGPPSDAARAKVADLAGRYGLDDLLTGCESVGQGIYVRNWGVSRNGTPIIFDYAQ